MRLTLAILLATLAVPGRAHAEAWENVSGGELLLVLPQLKANSPTSFASVGFGGRAFYGFGFADDFSALARFSFFTHSGSLPNVTRTGDRGTFTGDLAFNGEAYRLELGLRWKAISGYNLAPYLEAYGGYQWTTFRNEDLRNSRGASFGLQLANEGRGAPVTAAGAALEYRLFNSFLISVSCLYARAWDATYRGDLDLGVSAALSWF